MMLTIYTLMDGLRPCSAGPPEKAGDHSPLRPALCLDCSTSWHTVVRWDQYDGDIVTCPNCQSIVVMRTQQFYCLGGC